MHNVRAKSNPVSGALTLADPAAAPQLPHIYGVDFVPDDVSAHTAVRVMSEHVWWPATPGNNTPLVTWEYLSSLAPGQVVRF